MGRAVNLHTTVRFVCTTLEFFNADAKTCENFVLQSWDVQNNDSPPYVPFARPASFLTLTLKLVKILVYSGDLFFFASWLFVLQGFKLHSAPRLELPPMAGHWLTCNSTFMSFGTWKQRQTLILNKTSPEFFSEALKKTHSTCKLKCALVCKLSARAGTDLAFRANAL